MNNLKNYEYYIGKILTDLHFIVEHMKGVTIRTLGQNCGKKSEMNQEISQSYFLAWFNS